MVNVIVLVILAALIGCSVAYMVRAKKRGAKCIGCPAECGCSGKKEEHTGCGCHLDRPE